MYMLLRNRLPVYLFSNAQVFLWNNISFYLELNCILEKIFNYFQELNSIIFHKTQIANYDQCFSNLLKKQYHIFSILLLN